MKAVVRNVGSFVPVGISFSKSLAIIEKSSSGEIEKLKKKKIK